MACVSYALADSANTSDSLKLLIMPAMDDKDVLQADDGQFSEDIQPDVKTEELQMPEGFDTYPAPRVSYDRNQSKESEMESVVPKSSLDNTTDDIVSQPVVIEMPESKEEAKQDEIAKTDQDIDEAIDGQGNIPSKSEAINADAKESENTTINQTKEDEPAIQALPDFEEAKSEVLKYQEQLRFKKDSPDDVPQISKEDLKTAEGATDEEYTSISAAEFDAEKVQFISNETQVLMLPNDDVVLGKLTNEAQLALMSMYSYLEIFWKNYDRIERMPKRMEINQFINDYDKNFKK